MTGAARHGGSTPTAATPRGSGEGSGLDHRRIERELHEKLAHGYRLRFELDYARVFQDYWNGEILAEVDSAAAARTNADARGLDVGCGTGDFLVALRARVPRAIGADLSSDMIRAGPAGRERIAVVSAAEALPFRAGAFDLVVCKGSLHHTADLREALSEIRRVLRPRGAFVLSEPCNDSLPVRIARWVLYRVSSHFHPDDVAYFSRDFVRLLGEAGFRVEATRKFGYLGYALAGFPDHFGAMRLVPGRVACTRALVLLDRVLAATPVLRGLGFHFMARCVRVESGGRPVAVDEGGAAPGPGPQSGRG
jgi:ubiquinone/menaquinone biosynthesis C-methylase UbiE